MATLGVLGLRWVVLTAGQSLFVSTSGNDGGYVERYTDLSQTTRHHRETLGANRQLLLLSNGVADSILLRCTAGFLSWSVRQSDDDLVSAAGVDGGAP